MTDAYPLSGNEKEADARQVVERSREAAERGGRSGSGASASS